jgi:DNA invertase Pin-like site-specific DNA recombinase
MTTIGAYARVSTEEQSLRRQVDSTLGFARDRFDVDTGEQSDEEIAKYIASADASASPVQVGDVVIHFDRSTGTDVSRSGYQDLLASVRAGDVDAVVTHSVSRMARSIRDLDSTAEEIVEDAGVELHIISEGFELVPGEDDPFQRAMFRLLGVFAELEADLAQQRAREGLAARMNSDEYHHGPAPLGFRKEDGQLYRATNYDEVVVALEDVDAGEMSKRQAAKELETSRRSIGRALDDRRELYGFT